MSIGRLRRKLDVDLIEKIANGWKPDSNPEPAKRVKPPRPGITYRAARRNVAKDLGVMWDGVRAKYVGYRPKGKTYKPNGKRECARRRGAGEHFLSREAAE